MSRTLVTLITPPVAEPDALAPLLAAATEAGEVAAVILPLVPADERTLVRRVKALAPIAQAGNAALVIALAGPPPAGLDLATVATRGGADGVHAASLDEARDLRERLGTERIVGIGALRTRHDAMSAGEIGVDYLLFGEPRADGSLPPLASVIERAGWWAEIFETPCVAFAPSLDDVETLARTGAEFVGLGEAVLAAPDGPRAAMARASASLERIAEERAAAEAQARRAASPESGR